MPTIITRGAVSAYALGFARNMASGVVKDDYFEYVTMLLPGNGTNGAQNNTFLDSSSNAFSITRNGNTTQGTFSPYGSNWSNYFNGSTDYFTVPSNAAFQFGTGDFTIEFWVNKPAAANGPIVDARGSASAVAYALYIDASNFPYFYDGTLYTSTVAITTGQWNHVAVVKTSGTLKIFVNGVQGYSAAYSVTLSPSATVYIGGQNFSGGASYTAGYISNLRIVKGSAVYTAAFTPPTAPLTAITNTSLLICQSNRFIDNSSNAFAITLNGTPSVQRFSPFSPSAAYSTGTNGGSGYFDGTGDYLTVPDNTALEPGSSNLTWEMWINTTSSTQYATLYSRMTSVFSSGMWSLMINLASSTAGDVGLYVGDFNVSAPLLQTTGVNVRDGGWHHIAVVRNGSAWTIYVDGTSRATATWSGTISDIAGGPYIGHDQNYIRDFIGYISDLRIVKGTAVYTAAFTPPTAPLTAITNTSLLCSMTNAGIIDNAMMNDLETVGNAQISTTQSKFGGSSMYFDGTGDYLTVNNATANLCAFGTGDFTVEAWIYIASNSAIQILIDARGSQVASDPWQFYTSSTGKLVFNYGSNLTGSTTISANTWTHVAACRASGTLRLFVNGTQDTSATVTGSVNAVAPVYVGRTFDTSGTLYLNGYIDDLRITKGYARYTANFTAPTAAFPTS